MDFRRLTTRPVNGAAERPTEPPEKPETIKSPPEAVKSRPVTGGPAKRAVPEPFTVPDGGTLNFYRVQPSSGETLELLGVEDPKEVAAAVADLRGEEAWCLYIETKKGRQLIAASAPMKALLEKEGA